ncbi:uncharacterized protein LOC142321545 isoform X2 [Lycorma delicatula]|uniref:uncharacterized protein LOC142321545 isoform X2 n=1 Tax=Lycorma delicatula TaxID=130591 RepID=UPI003F51654F
MMKKSLCVSKNNKQPSNKLSLSSSATTTIFSAGIKVAITSLFVIVFSAPINEAAVIQGFWEDYSFQVTVTLRIIGLHHTQFVFCKEIFYEMFNKVQEDIA